MVSTDQTSKWPFLAGTKFLTAPFFFLNLQCPKNSKQDFLGTGWEVFTSYLDNFAVAVQRSFELSQGRQTPCNQLERTHLALPNPLWVGDGEQAGRWSDVKVKIANALSPRNVCHFI